MTKGTLGLVLIASAVIVILAAAYFLGSFRPAALAGFRALLAQVGVAVGIAPNPYNTLDAQLTAKQAQLDEEQADLAAREAAFASTTASTTPMSNPSTVWYLVMALGVLAFLVGLNFYMDWRRSQRSE